MRHAAANWSLYSDDRWIYRCTFRWIAPSSDWPHCGIRRHLGADCQRARTCSSTHGVNSCGNLPGVDGRLSLGAIGRVHSIPLIAGFTLGIAVTIALIQLKDFFGLTFSENPESNFQRITQIASTWRSWRLGDTAVGVFTLVALIGWGKMSIGKRIPGALIILPIAALLAVLLGSLGLEWTSSTIDSRFGSVVDGKTLGGIPLGLPSFALP